MSVQCRPNWLVLTETYEHSVCQQGTEEFISRVQAHEVQDVYHAHGMHVIPRHEVSSRRHWKVKES